MDFQTLKASVESSIGRSDVPDFVYTLMMSDINRDIRILEMQSSTTLSVSSEATALPADYLMVESMYVDTNPRSAMVPVTQQSQGVRHNSSGKPYYYAITDGELQVMPVPDGTYSVVMRYYAKLADFSNSTDDNAVINLHPGLFLHSAIYHAAVWAQDFELAAGYSAAYKNLAEMVSKTDIKKRNNGPMIQRSAIQI